MKEHPGQPTFQTPRRAGWCWACWGEPSIRDSFSPSDAPLPVAETIQSHGTISTTKPQHMEDRLSKDNGNTAAHWSIILDWLYPRSLLYLRGVHTGSIASEHFKHRLQRSHFIYHISGSFVHCCLKSLTFMSMLRSLDGTCCVDVPLQMYWWVHVSRFLPPNISSLAKRTSVYRFLYFTSVCVNVSGSLLVFITGETGCSSVWFVSAGLPGAFYVI